MCNKVFSYKIYPIHSLLSFSFDFACPELVRAQDKSAIALGVLILEHP